jgi:hypothetical protein
MQRKGGKEAIQICVGLDRAQRAVTRRRVDVIHCSNRYFDSGAKHKVNISNPLYMLLIHEPYVRKASMKEDDGMIQELQPSHACIG